MQRLSKCAAAMAALAALALSGGAGLAQQAAPIILKSDELKIRISGNLVSFDGTRYVVDTELGRLAVAADSITCVGIVCPVSGAVEETVEQPVEEVIDPRFGIYGSRTVGTTLIPNLLRGWAESMGAAFEIEATDKPSERIVRISNADGSLRNEIFLQTKGSGSAFPALAEGKAAIGVADRRMKDSDVEKIRVAGVPDLRGTGNETVLGVDGIVLITHPDNPVRNLSAEEVSKIFAGEITNWFELGGGNFPINLNSFGESSGDRAVLMDALVRPYGRDETAQVARWSAYQDMVDAVMADRGGLGYVGRWLARTNDVNLLTIREECGLLSPPTDFRMKIEGYSLSRRLYAYTRPDDIHPDAQAFLDWTLTKEAQPYIKQSHFIDRELERMRLEDMGMMLIHTAAVEPDFDGAQYARMMAELRHADRLSLSFRFQTGSSALDSESLRNLQELAGRMKAGEFNGFEMLLVGFADSVGGRVRNTELAQERALAVREILSRELTPEAAEKLKLVPLSYGELMPLSCNTDDVGRARNRRVEVWLRLPNTRISLR